MTIPQNWQSDPTLVSVAKAIYEAKKQDAWGNWKSEYRKSWPSDAKALRKALHEESDPGIEFAFVQARAAIEVLI